MRTLLMFSIIVIGLVSCEKEKSENTDLVLSDDYLPLSVGNEWTFELSGRQYISEKQTINGLEYYKFIDNYGISMFYRIEGDKIYKLSSLDDTGELLFDLAASLNEKWEYSIGYAKLVDRNATVEIEGVEIDNCLQFNYFSEDLMVMDYGFSIWLAPGIGFVQRTCQECYNSAFETLKLEKAIIDRQLIEFN